MTSSSTSSGILLVDKESDWTSHDVVAKVRRLAGTRKVGHAGTLDPMATGLLVLGINSSTRLLTYLTGCDKVYEATIRLGASTSTDDAQGEALGYASHAQLERITRDDVGAGVARLTGVIAQVPSSVSAIKVNGQRAYARVRAGEAVELAAREVVVSRFEIRDVRPGVAFDGHFATDVDVLVECSSGTYIRALARDLGFSLGVGGHLTRLRRTRVGPFDVTDARNLADPTLMGALLPAATAAARMFPVIEMSDETARDLMHGKRPNVDHADSAGPLSAVSPQGTLIGLVSVVSGKLVSLVNFPPDE